MVQLVLTNLCSANISLIKGFIDRFIIKPVQLEPNQLLINWGSMDYH